MSRILPRRGRCCVVTAVVVRSHVSIAGKGLPVTKESPPVRVGAAPLLLPPQQVGLPLREVGAVLSDNGPFWLGNQETPIVLDRRSGDVGRKLSLSTRHPQVGDPQRRRRE